MAIQPLRTEHWPRVREIYREGIATGNATFETSAPEWETWDADHLRELRLVATVDGEVMGWAALSAISDRCAYGGVAEVSVYVDARSRGHGLGRSLLRRLIKASERQGFWTLQAGVFPENEASLRLHHRLGFRTVGVRQRLGKLGDRWRDVIMLERRSEVAGTE